MTVGRRATRSGARRARVPLLALAAAAFAAAALVVVGEPDPFAACEARFTADPDGLDTCHCFYAVAIEHGFQDAAARRLAAHLETDPQNPCLNMRLGRLRMLAGDPEAAALLRAAAAGYARRGETAGEVYARVNLSRFLRPRDGDAARGELEAARQVAAGGEDPMLIAQVELEQARFELAAGSDLERVDRLLRQVEDQVFPGGQPSLQRDTLQALGNVRYLLGRFGAAAVYYRRMAEVAGDSGDLYGEASARYAQVIAWLAQASGPGRRQEAITLLEQALAAAVTAGQRYAEADARLRLGKLFGGAQGRGELRRGVELARGLGDDGLLARGLGSLGAALLPTDPAAARRLVDEALSLALGSPHFGAGAYGWSDRMSVVWATSPRAEALAENLAVLDLVEHYRDLQRAAGGKAEFFSVWTEVYHALAGRLLDPTGDDPPDLAVAFAVAERMRGRVLLESLEAARALPAASRTPAAREERKAVLEQLVEVNRRLLDPGLDQQAHAAALAELERLERREAESRDRAERRAAGAQTQPPAGGTRAQRRAGGARTQRRAGLAQVEAALEPDQALLSFHVAPWTDVYGNFTGGSWLIAATRAGSRVYRLPGAGELAPQLKVFANRLAYGEHSPAAARRLYDELLGPALAELPAAVEHLVIVPDGILYRLPMAALTDREDAPLAARYRLSMVPSATLWLRWGASTPPAASGSVLVFADPVPAAPAALAPLPAARREGRSAVRHLRRRSELLIGERASERALKALEPGAFQLLHFAAHAVVDAEHPHRSAVVLAPGGPDQDGLLQPREIAALELGGGVVLLSACESAGGEVLRGEGPLSLARAFFEAGSRAVVASLWPLRDDQAAELFDRFYRHLSTGSSVADALAAAQRDALAAGRPPSAWAGVAVYGDGDAVPVRGEPRGNPRPVIAVLALALAAILAALARPRRGQSV